MTFTVFALPS